MSAPTYLGRHAELRPGDLILLPHQGDPPAGWRVANGEIVWKIVDGEDCLRSLGPHRSLYAYAFRGTLGVEHHLDHMQKIDIVAGVDLPARNIARAALAEERNTVGGGQIGCG